MATSIRLDKIGYDLAFQPRDSSYTLLFGVVVTVKGCNLKQTVVAATHDMLLTRLTHLQIVALLSFAAILLRFAVLDANLLSTQKKALLLFCIIASYNRRKKLGIVVLKDLEALEETLKKLERIIVPDIHDM
ncbi:hypothetical protein QVD17_07214 [Tagetes erecta]|uniref:Uncharacterized protein n=1 Tax=Tagetes erecta TaxID=13708 RepID=A0AAD8PCH6_TARER|nr:hypothetical protein QVD17_07214 [Tagetes erecta]